MLAAMLAVVKAAVLVEVLAVMLTAVWWFVCLIWDKEEHCIALGVS